MMLFSYLKSKIKIAVMLLCFAAIFAVIFALFALPLSTVLYASLISLVTGLVFALIDYCLFLKKHRLLSGLRETARVSDISDDHFPSSSSPIESDYRALLISLLNEQRARELADFNEKSEMIDYFTLWAHQVKTPIAAMRLILQGEDTVMTRELEAQLFTTSQYVDMVLAYLRSGSESTDYLFKEYSLQAIVKQAVRKYAAMFIRKKLSLELELDQSRVLTDEKWLCFVIEQLISNAIKYTSQGSITISCSENRLVISDTGIGIIPEDLPRVFERSFTGRNGRVDKHSSGIGLYLSKQILTKLGHEIKIESIPDRGTSVYILFNRNPSARD